MLSWKKSFGLSWNLWPEFFTKKSKVQHYKIFKTNHPQACIRNQDRQGRSHFSGDITIRTCPIKSDSNIFPEIGMDSSFKAALINIYIVTMDQITECNIKGIACTDNTTDITWPRNAIWFGFMARILTVLIQSYRCNPFFTSMKQLFYAQKSFGVCLYYYPTDYTTCPAFWYKRES